MGTERASGMKWENGIKRTKLNDPLSHFFLIGIHSVQGLTATTRHGVTRKKTQKKITGYRKSV